MTLSLGALVLRIARCDTNNDGHIDIRIATRTDENFGLMAHLAMSDSGDRDDVGGRALKEFGPNTFEIMQSIVSQKNNQAQVGSSSGNTGHGAQRWVLHEVLHGCLGTIPGNSFSFVIRNEGASEGFRDEKSTLPGY
ncbi:protein of unknown function [Taphrina deformans PYCC 5710]|uniref:Uncharacterized protein n=1 Tax=Taphrina deformans (strain PYCC 5710 / ATCC 11124 / CBS 356.35 / IMI 108563 / JCM 9778 / NBRC 8474) TaxID=1097556 RepID=R4XGE2_TAPDE|nr:protein of unknown function [Taphrina deformans PYCC 5710]|eukprot:CCG84967.1 protein of unknown function [Taphrina deformans PYCC 5710]